MPEDYAEAVKWYRLAADHGLAIAQYFLGSMYEYGEGAPQDYARAHMWYNLAAAQGLRRRESSNRLAQVMPPQLEPTMLLGS